MRYPFTMTLAPLLLLPLMGVASANSTGIGTAHYGSSLAVPFFVQSVTFIALYTLITLRLGVEVAHWYGIARAGSTGRMNAVLVVTSVGFFSTIVQVVYIVVVDLVMVAPVVGNSLRCFTDCAWYWAFAYLSFFWVELLTSNKRGIKTIDTYRRPLILCVGAFTMIRVLLAVFESEEEMESGEIVSPMTLLSFWRAFASFRRTLVEMSFTRVI